MPRAVVLMLLVAALDLRAADYSPIEPTNGFCDFKPIVVGFSKLLEATDAISPPKDDPLFTAGFKIRLDDAIGFIAVEQNAWRREAQIMKTYKDQPDLAVRIDVARPLEMAGRLSYPLVLLGEVGTYLVLKHQDARADDLMAATEEMSKQIYRYVACEAEVKRVRARAEASPTGKVP